MVTRRLPGGQGELAIWTNGLRVGHWRVHAGQDQLDYDPAWIESPLGRPLSRSLPFMPGNRPHKGDVVRHFFDNLLPDNDGIRRRLKEKFGTRDVGTFSLLSAIGRDCVGAVQLLAPDEAPTGWDRIEAQPLDDAGVERMIDQSLASGHALGQGDSPDLRISIAGAQEKTALLLRDGQWCKPLGATPTTHILKLPLGLVGNMLADMSDSVENEWLCARLLAALGLPVATCGMATFGRRRVLVVERFDRRLVQPPGAPAWWARLPQEDMCQALGQPGSLKYESDGGPGMAAILRTLQAGSAAQSDTRTFVLAQLAFWLMAATDGHAKNFSIFLEPGQGYRMTPLYDVLSAWPIIGHGPNQVAFKRAKLAMALRSKNTHYHLHEIQTRHWQVLARQAGIPFDQLADLVERVPQAFDTVQAQLPAGFPERVWRAIRDGTGLQARRFLGALKEG